jgi:hypothetical protein
MNMAFSILVFSESGNNKKSEEGKRIKKCLKQSDKIGQEHDKLKNALSKIIIQKFSFNMEIVQVFLIFIGTFQT